MSMQRDQILSLRTDLEERSRLVGVLEECHSAAERKLIEVRTDRDDVQQVRHALRHTLSMHPIDAPYRYHSLYNTSL